jgi:hypothetical protein
MRRRIRLNFAMSNFKEERCARDNTKMSPSRFLTEHFSKRCFRSRICREL